MKTLFKKYDISTYAKYLLSYLIVFSLLITGFFFIIRTQLSKSYFRQRSEQAGIQLDNFVSQLNIISITSSKNIHPAQN